MENKKGKTLKLISYISLCAFSLVSLFSGVLAWFTARRVQDPDSDSMRVVNPTGIFNQVSVHELFGMQKHDDGKFTYHFRQTPKGTIRNDGSNRPVIEGTPSLSLGRYNLLEPRHPVLLLFTLNTFNDSGVTIKGDTDATFLGNLDQNDQILYDDDENEATKKVPRKDGDSLALNGQFPLSSVVKFASKVLVDANPSTDGLQLEADPAGSTNVNTNTLTDTTAVYSTTKSNETESNVSCFTFIYGSEYSYESFVDFSTNPSGTTLSSVEFFRQNTTPKYVALIFDYYDFAIETIYNAYLGIEEVSDPDNPLEYCCDFSMTI